MSAVLMITAVAHFLEGEMAEGKSKLSAWQTAPASAAIHFLPVLTSVCQLCVRGSILFARNSSESVPFM